MAIEQNESIERVHSNGRVRMPLFKHRHDDTTDTVEHIEKEPQFQRMVVGEYQENLGSHPLKREPRGQYHYRERPDHENRFFDKERYMMHASNHHSSKHYSPSDPKRVHGHVAIVPFAPLFLSKIDETDMKDFFALKDENRHVKITNSTPLYCVLGVDLPERKETGMSSEDWYRFGAFGEDEHLRLFKFPRYLPASFFEGKKDGDEIIIYFNFVKFTLTIKQERIVEWAKSDITGFKKGIFSRYLSEKNTSFEFAREYCDKQIKNA